MFNQVNGQFSCMKTVEKHRPNVVKHLANASKQGHSLLSADDHMDIIDNRGCLQVLGT